MRFAALRIPVLSLCCLLASNHEARGATLYEPQSIPCWAEGDDTGLAYIFIAEFGIKIDASGGFDPDLPDTLSKHIESCTPPEYRGGEESRVDYEQARGLQLGQGKCECKLDMDGCYPLCSASMAGQLNRYLWECLEIERDVCANNPALEDDGLKLLGIQILATGAGSTQVVFYLRIDYHLQGTNNASLTLRVARAGVAPVDCLWRQSPLPGEPQLPLTGVGGGSLLVPVTVPDGGRYNVELTLQDTDSCDPDYQVAVGETENYQLSTTNSPIPLVPFQRLYSLCSD